jgi:retron-type reverse transcriptase
MGVWDTIKRWFGVSDGESALPRRDVETTHAEGEGPVPAARSAPRARTAAPSVSPAAPKRGEDAYAADGILGLSAEEFRKRALKINPYKTAWIGRVDTIPPQSDERTALIDRGLMLRGFLTRAQLEEIHRVGDIWLRHHDAISLAKAIGKKKGEQAVEAHRAERAARKAEKQRASLAKREARREAVARRRAEDIIFAGRGVSGKLHDRRSNNEALTGAGLPVLSTPADVARALGIQIPELRWLVFHAESSERTHYSYFEVPKRSGGKRLLAAPRHHLRKAQRWVLEQILTKVAVTEHAHGFVAGRSTVTNARPHRGRHLIATLDLKDFFPSITFVRVRGLFESFGYSPAVATLLALICTEAPRTAVEIDGKRYWVVAGERALPQGACVSPSISNLIARKLDRRLAGSANALGFDYTRYADDLTFSARTPAVNVASLLARVRHVVAEEGFAVNPKKGRVQRRGGRQEVTGVVVNDKLGVPRAEIRRLRALLHNAKKTGLSAQNREQRPHFEAWLRGKIGYIMMIDPTRGKALAAALDECAP